MSSEPTIGRRLIALKARSSLSLAQIADRAGYQGASSIQKLFRPDYAPDRLQQGVARKLAKAFVGFGLPPIEEGELLALANVGSIFDKLVADLAHQSFEASRYIIVSRTKRINTAVETDSGANVPLFAFDERERDTTYYMADERIWSKRVSAFYAIVGNMWPRYEEGEVVFYERSTPPMPGDDVLLTLIDDHYVDGGMVVGRLALLRDDEVQIDQFSPKGRIIVARREVISVYRILNRTDLLPPVLYAKGID